MFKKMVLYFLKECFYKQKMSQFNLLSFFVQIFRSSAIYDKVVPSWFKGEQFLLKFTMKWILDPILAFIDSHILYYPTFWSFKHGFFILLAFLFLCFNFDGVFSFCELIDPTKTESLVKSPEDSSSLEDTSSPTWVEYLLFLSSILGCCLLISSGGLVPFCCKVSVYAIQVFSIFFGFVHTGTERLAKVGEVEKLQDILKTVTEQKLEHLNPNSATYRLMSNLYDEITTGISIDMEYLKSIPVEIPCDPIHWDKLQSLIEVLQWGIDKFIG